MPFWLEVYILVDAICICGSLLLVCNARELVGQEAYAAE